MPEQTFGWAIKQMQNGSRPEPTDFERGKVIERKEMKMKKNPSKRRVSRSVRSNPMPAVTWGRPYGDDPAVNSHGRKIYMFRKGQKVRWYDSYGDQVGPEQANVAPALAWSYSKGYESEFLKGRGIRPVRKNPSKLPTAPKHTATGERIDSRCTST